jgi:hypothetical protein
MARTFFDEFGERAQQQRAGGGGDLYGGAVVAVQQLGQVAQEPKRVVL